jgi:hypothetical protein
MLSLSATKLSGKSVEESPQGRPYSDAINLPALLWAINSPKCIGHRSCCPTLTIHSKTESNVTRACSIRICELGIQDKIFKRIIPFRGMDQNVHAVIEQFIQSLEANIAIELHASVQGTEVEIVRKFHSPPQRFLARLQTRPPQSRSNSLMLVFPRVLSSTVFTITTQYSEAPGSPFGAGLPGNVPATTTEFAGISP